MSNLTIQINDYVSPFAKDLPKIASIDDLVYVEKYETDAWGHWIFADNSTSLVDKVNNRSLTLQSGATVQPIYDTNHVRLATKSGNALLTGLNDSLSAFTQIAVVQPESTELTAVLGNLGAFASPQGIGIFTSSSKVYLTSRTGISSWDVGLNLDMAKPVLIGYSLDKTASAINFIAMQNGIMYTKTSPSGTFVAANTELAVGNSRYTSSSTNYIKYYESIAYNKALTLSELQAVATRSKKRLEYRGITF